jgi:D-glycero-alpha-D-manno-heptose-7-phosphate kinase
MIITATPFRISFLGGGTDYPAWFKRNGGAVLSVTINKYCYLQCRNLPPFFEYKNRVVWSRIETTNDNDSIEHPAVREAFRYLGITQGLEVHHFGDLPARTGLGSSSSFAVGLLHALYSLRGEIVSKRRLADEAIHLEQTLLKENVGIQDQIAAAFGGLNRVDIGQNGDYAVQPVLMSEARKRDFEEHMILLFTGIARHASDVARKQIDVLAKQGKEDVVRRMQALVDEGIEVLANGRDLRAFGELLDESWRLKRSISDAISTETVDEIYARALRAGAIGGKLLGAGGGGFMLLFVEPAKRAQISAALAGYLQIPFRFERAGSRIVLFEPDA